MTVVAVTISSTNPNTAELKFQTVVNGGVVLHKFTQRVQNFEHQPEAGVKDEPCFTQALEAGQEFTVISFAYLK